MRHTRRNGVARERALGPGLRSRPESREPKRSLSVRQSWCRAGEPIRWVFAQRRVRFDVVGLDDTGVPGGRGSAEISRHLAPDVTAFALGARSRSMALLSRERISRRQAPSEVDLDDIPADWVLTTQRLAAVVVAWAAGPAAPARMDELVSWFEIDRREITAVQEARRSARPVCRVLLHDGSGFDFHTSPEAVRDMVAMAHGRA